FFGSPIIFNPFQTLKPNETVKYLPEIAIQNTKIKVKEFSVDSSLNKQVKNNYRKITSKINKNNFKTTKTFIEIQELINQNTSPEEIANMLYEKSIIMKQNE